MKYSVVLLQGDDPGYTVVVPELPGCVTEGDTIESALISAKDAIELWLETLVAQGEPIPQEIEAPIVMQVEVNPNLPKTSNAPPR